MLSVLLRRSVTGLYNGKTDQQHPRAHCLQALPAQMLPCSLRKSRAA